MAGEKDSSQDPRLDEDGIVIHEYESTVLVVLPPEGFNDATLRFVRSSLEGVGIGTRSASRRYDEMVKGRLQDEFLVDEKLEDQKMEDYSGVFLVAGETEDLETDEEVLRLLREANTSGKWIATFGTGLAALARADILRGKKVTGSRSCEEEAQRVGAKYTGRQLEVSENVVTALDECSGLRFGRAFAELVKK